LAGERVALNLIQHLSGVATITNQFVQAVAGTRTQIVDSRQGTPGLRMLERYAVTLGGGSNGRFGLDDGVVISSNHSAMSGGLAAAVKTARERLGHLYKIAVEVSDKAELTHAIEQGADNLIFEDLTIDEARPLITHARELSETISIECSGSGVNVESARAFAEAGADLLSINTLNGRAPNVSFKLSAF
jgi:nicotinate-nucleotide pyrophosphorylase (carboxylating)